jgi:hypothetical protein
LRTLLTVATETPAWAAIVAIVTRWLAPGRAGADVTAPAECP